MEQISVQSLALPNDQENCSDNGQIYEQQQTFMEQQPQPQSMIMDIIPSQPILSTTLNGLRIEQKIIQRYHDLAQFMLRIENCQNHIHEQLKEAKDLISKTTTLTTTTTSEAITKSYSSTNAVIVVDDGDSQHTREEDEQEEKEEKCENENPQGQNEENQKTTITNAKPQIEEEKQKEKKKHKKMKPQIQKNKTTLTKMKFTQTTITNMFDHAIIRKTKNTITENK
jgi:hypothetical protein